jgi:hypothetical protein
VATIASSAATIATQEVEGWHIIDVRGFMI